MAQANPFSRCALHPSFEFKLTRKPFLVSPSKKKGGGAPISASNRVPRPQPSSPIREGGQSRGYGARPCSVLTRLRETTGAAGTPWSGRARLSAPHRGVHRGLASARLRAALPGTTGCKREDPLRHQCSEHLAVRSRAGRVVAQAARRHSVWLPPARTAPAPP
jgi:hypothetical protein